MDMDPIEAMEQRHAQIRKVYSMHGGFEDTIDGIMLESWGHASRISRWMRPNCFGIRG